MSIAIDLSSFPKIVNRVYYPIFKDQHRYLVLYGGAGSGKSVTAAQKIIYRMITESGHKFLGARKVGNTIRDSIRAELIDAIVKMGVSDLFSWSPSPSGEMTIVGPNGNSIIFRGLDDREKIKSIKDITGMWIEEASELTEEDFDQLDLRLRGQHLKNYKQIILTFNPISEFHWLKARFFDRIDPDAFVLRTTYLDNQFIDEDYVRKLEKLRYTNESYYRVYALGEWGTLKGQIYENWDVVEKLPEHFEIEVCGLDFGYNHPQALVHIRIDGEDVYFDEAYYESERENGYMITKIKKDRPELMKIKTWADAARPDLISECRRAGWNIEAGKKDVFAGINLLKSKRLHVTARSKNLIKELKTYCWKIDKDGNAMDEPVKEMDDGLDALRYGVFSTLGGPSRKIGSGRVSI